VPPHEQIRSPVPQINGTTKAVQLAKGNPLPRPLELIVCNCLSSS
jgi:hypothetical protein